MQLRASNKLSTFRALENAGVPIPDYTTDPEEALEYPKVVARGVLNGNSGEGIVIVDTDSLDRLPDAPLYTKFIPQKAEYRVHVFNGEVISYAKKERADGDEPTELQSIIRSHNNGWIFRKEGLRRLERVETIAKGAISVGKKEGIDLFKVADRGKAISKALSLAKKDDLILITGKGAEQFICGANGQKIPWDDREVFRKILKNK